MLLRTLFCALALVLVTFGSAMAEYLHDEAPFNEGPILMGTSPCGRPVPCSNLSRNSSQIIAAANACMKDKYYVEKRLISEFRSTGEFKNCAVSGSSGYDLNKQNLPRWGVCCVTGTDTACSLSCSLYMNPRSAK